MTHHLGYEKNQSRPGTNSRNGYSPKTVITGDVPLELRTPRDRDGTFEPQLVKKHQTRIIGMDVSGSPEAYLLRGQINVSVLSGPSGKFPMLWTKYPPLN